MIFVCVHRLSFFLALGGALCFISRQYIDTVLLWC